MLNVGQFRDYVIVPALDWLEEWRLAFTPEKSCLNSPEAVSLLLGTALTESHLTYIKQLGGGPALGFFQMEPATHDDIWQNWIVYQPNLEPIIRDVSKNALPEDMIWNMQYAAIMCRLHYRRVPKSLPTTVFGMAQYWKKYYNTKAGKGRIEDFVSSAEQILTTLGEI